MDTALKTTAVTHMEPVWTGGVCRELTEEYVVPDSMPDVGEVVGAEGVVTVTGKDTEPGCVQLSAALTVSVAYAPEGGNGLRGLELTVPVSLRMDAAGADTDCVTTAALRLRSLDARVVNSRKLAIRAEAEASACCWRSGALTVAVGMEAEDAGAHVRQESAEIMLVTDVREKTFAMTDEYALPASFGGAARILTRRCELLTEEVKYVGGKVLFRGRVRSELLFAEEAGEKAAVGRYETEFSQLMEVEAGEGEDALPEVSVFLTGAYYDMPEYSQDQSRLQAEFHLGAQCVCRCRRQLRYMSDVYSNRTVLVPQTEKLVLTGGVRPVLMRQTVADRVEGADRDAELLQATASVAGVYPEDGCVKTSVNVRMIFLRKDGGCSSARGRLNAEFTLPELSSGETLQDAEVTVTDIYAVPGAGDVRVSLRLDANAAAQAEITVVTAVEEDEEAAEKRGRTPSAVLVRVPAGADLWELARRCRSTVEDILLVNEGRRDGLLLIPKGR